MSEIGNEIGKDKVRKEEEKTKIEKKESHKELPVLRRMTKRQVQEVYSLFEEDKTLEEVSKHFESRYNCKPLSKERLRKHLTNFYKLKDRIEDNKIHHLQPPVSIITNQDIRELKEKMFSLPPTNNLSNSLENYKIVSNERDDSLSSIPLKFLVFVVIAILILFVILRRREKKEEKKKKSLKELDPQKKLRNLNIKWV